MALSKDATDESEVDSANPNFSQVLKDCLAGGVIAVDASGIITILDAGAERILGLEAAEAVGRPVSVLPSVLRELIERARATGAAIEEQHIDLPGPDNTQIRVRVSMAIGRSSGGKGREVVVILNDVTPANNLETHTRRLEQLASIGTLAASMAHEIKNAMVAVKTFADVLLKKNQDSELASIVAREMRRINAIVSQLLRFAGPARPGMTPLHLHHLLEQAFSLIQHQVQAKQIRLQLALDASPDLVRGDAYQLEQAFINIFFNSLEAMAPMGVLQVTTELVEDSSTSPRLWEGQTATGVRITIKDTGIGIPPENIPRLFESFFTTKPEGTGLGLPITRRIVEEHKGTIRVESALNQGTTFFITLPLARHEFRA